MTPPPDDDLRTVLDIYSAAELGHADVVERLLAATPKLAQTAGGSRGWDALTCLCFSNHLKHEPDRADDFLRAASALLIAGANPNTGYWEQEHQPKPEWESALYAASSLARNPALTRLLLQFGADPNDPETPYHAPEGYNNQALEALVESGRLTADSLATMLLRKADWHDEAGVGYLLQHGADPNRMTTWGYTALHQSLRRDNGIEIIQSMLDHGADPALTTRREGQTAFSIAARRGRADVLELFEQRGFPTVLAGVDRLIAACARNRAEEVQSIAAAEPHLMGLLLAEGGTLLAEFAGTANTGGVGQLLDLGVDVAAPYQEGDGYFCIAPRSTALHVAAWRAWPETVKYLLERGASVHAVDAEGHTALALAVRACVDSYWTRRRSPESTRALLEAGADAGTVPYPCGYDEVDALLSAYRAQR
jgi:ankyrin repeat protein